MPLACLLGHLCAFQGLVLHIRLFGPQEPHLPVGTGMKKLMGQVSAAFTDGSVLPEIDRLIIAEPAGVRIVTFLVVIFLVRELHDLDDIAEGQGDLLWDTQYSHASTT